MMFYSRRVYRTGGLNSITPDGLHIPMFDLDNCNIRELETEINLLQDAFHLGDCLCVSTGKLDSYHIYFLNKVSWRQAILIGTSCRFVDLKHIQFSLKRGHFTLRLLDKAGRKPYLYNTYYSENPNTLTKKDLKSFVLYETANK